MSQLIPAPHRLVDPFGNELTVIGEPWTPDMVMQTLVQVLAAAGGRVYIPNGLTRLIPPHADIEISAHNTGRAVTLRDFEPGDRRGFRAWLRVQDAWRDGYIVSPEVKP